MMKAKMGFDCIKPKISVVACDTDILPQPLTKFKKNMKKEMTRLASFRFS
jgi:hypothetical protein